LFTHITNNYPEYIYKFPDLLPEEVLKLEETVDVDIYNQLFNDYIKQ
jgi:hypothetical protein